MTLSNTAAIAAGILIGALGAPAVAAASHGADDQPTTLSAPEAAHHGSAVSQAGAPGATDDRSSGAVQPEPGAGGSQRHGSRNAQTDTTPRGGHGHHSGRSSDRFDGTLKSVDVAAHTIVVTVRRANRHGQAQAGRDIAFDASALDRLDVRDTNGDGSQDLADLTPGDRIVVRTTGDATSEPAATRTAVRVTDKGQRT